MPYGKDYGKEYMQKDSKSHNNKYMSKGMGGKEMGHDKSPSSLTVPCGGGFKEVKPFREGNKGYPSQAFSYKY